MDNIELVRTTYNHIAASYSDTYASDFQDAPFLKEFTSFLPQNGAVLDVGCGPGQWVKYLYKQGYEAQGIDLSEEMIMIAEKDVPERKFSVMDMRELSFPDSTFDGILSMYSLIHIPDADVLATLKGFARVVKSKGILGLVVQKGEQDHIVLEPFDKTKTIFINFYTKEKLKSSLEEAGFEILSIEQVPFHDPEGLTDALIYIIAKKI